MAILCKYLDCKNEATYCNKIDWIKQYCKEHKTDELVYYKYKYKLCKSCKNYTGIYGYENDTKNKYCNNCKKDDMINLSNKRCIHNILKTLCSECGGGSLCIHNKEKRKCKECKGSSFCIHNNLKTNCRECGGSAICIHNLMKYNCKECNGSGICIHGKFKTICKECGGSAYCIHNKLKQYCLDCGGVSMCIHNKRKANCRICDGNNYCIHDRLKQNCKDCIGSQICEHGKRKAYCIECGGSQMCEHNVRKEQCKDCNLQSYLINLQRHQIRRCFNISSLEKLEHSIDYLGCNIEEFVIFFQNKIDYYNNFMATEELMTYENIHIDHIKPISVFNLDDEKEFLECCNYTNMQPLLIKENLEKSNKWNEDKENYWNNNIKNNKDYCEIYI